MSKEDGKTPNQYAILKDFNSKPPGRQAEIVNKAYGVLGALVPLRDMSEEDRAAYLDGYVQGVEYETAVTASFLAAKTKKDAEDMLAEFEGIDGKLVLTTEAEIHSRPAPEWWVEGLIQKGTIAILASPGGLGKTFLSIHLSRCIATGMMFYRRPVQTGRVLYVIAEGTSAFGVRTRAWDSYFNNAPPAGSIAYVESGVNLASEASVTRLADLVRDGEYDFIILDTLSQLGGIENENDASQAKRALQAAKRVRDAREGATVLIVHHTDARATKARGSTVIRDNADTVIMARGKSSGFTLTTDAEHGGKQKDGSATEIKGLAIQEHLDSAVVVWTGKTAADPWWTAMLPLLEDGEAVSGTKLRDACGVTASVGSEYTKWTRYMKELVANQVVIKGGARNSHTYRLPGIMVKAA